MDSTKNGASFTNISVEEHFSGQFVGPTEQISTAAETLVGRSTTLTEALKAAAINVGHKPVETTDMAAIKEVEARVTEGGGGVAAVAEKAVGHNKITGQGDKKMKLRDVIAEIDVKVTRDKTVTSEDVEAVVQAELSHSPLDRTIPGGIAESVTAAYTLNSNLYL
ncbi:Late embryogenesis abundant protein 49 [Cardamine amara subsp. amara]|uniref:Late embryogenesis abundant protein 49 n=1 Tax=Cardamine amara subsp. amara TaxID=228776 RepID=A0ABD1AJP6_CARAN